LHHFNWTPGIGDPTIGGWITVVLYFLAVISCWLTARDSETKDRKIWIAISFLFLGLGINKQLDLQTALTEFGRTLAFQYGWYGQRQSVQVAFIVVVAIVCVGAVMAFLIGARSSAAPIWLAILGTILVVSFVLIRAASFHHIDRFIGQKILGFRWNWILEMGGICVVLLASEWGRRATSVKQNGFASNAEI
jgi:ABC-type dipeptide/oligopeptide/nickel transport system permease subunit